MVLQNIQATLPVGNKGFVSRPRGDFQPGEYKRLSNVEILEEKIVGRRNMKMPDYGSGDEYVQRSGLRHVGFWQNWTVYSDDLSLVAYSTSGEVKTMADLTNLLPYTGYGIVGVGPFTYDGFHRVVGFFTYLGYNYILVFSYVTRTDSSLNQGDYKTSSGYKLYRFKDTSATTTPPTTDTNSLYLVGADESYNNTIPLPDTWVPGLEFQAGVASESDFMNSYINNFFFFKDRLFICTKMGLFFSRPTDPGDFSLVNGGGYFKTGELLTYAVASDDQIYVFSKNSTYVITYSEDPNVDASVSKISDTIGGITGCIFRSNIYFINNEGLFTVNNNNVEKVMDTDFDDGLNVFPSQTLSSFGEYLVLNKTYESSLSDTPFYSDDYGVRTNLIVGSSERSDTHGLGNNLGDKPNSDSIWQKLDATKDSISIETATDLPFASGQNVQVAKITNLDSSGGHSIVGMFSPPTAVQATSRYNITPGEIYTLSAYFQAGAGWTDDGLNQFFKLDFYDAAGTLKGDSYTPPYNGFQVLEHIKPTLIIGSWVRASITFKANNQDYTKLAITVGASNIPTAGYCRVGGIQLEQVGEVTDFISENNTDWKASFLPQTQFPASTSSFRTLITNPAFVYWKDVYPHWFEEGNDPNGNLTGFNTYFINMDNGTVHVLDYKAMFETEYSGFISNIAVNTNFSDEVPNGDTLFFLNSDRYGTTDDLPNQYVSYMNYELDTVVYDHVVAAGSRKKADPRYLVEIDSYSPDGSEYMMKKFRNFEVMGKFPKKRFEFSRAIDNNNYSSEVDVNDDPALSSSPLRLHLPHRLGINQRGRSISLKLATKLNAPLDEDYDFFELSDMKFLWMNTNRDVKSRSFTPTPG